MDITDQERTQEIIEALKARLHERELQQARLGVDADPIVATEIRQIKTQIRQTEKRLAKGVEDATIHVVIHVYIERQ